jgi:peroxiredoxin
LPFIVAYDAQGSISQAFGNISVTPTAFVLDPQGKIINKTIGDFNFAKLHQQLQEQLKQRPM